MAYKKATFESSGLPSDLNIAHGVAGLPRRWMVTNDGIVVVGEDRPRRTPGKPATLTRIFAKYGPLIGEAADATGLSMRLIAAVIATESRGLETAERYEKGPDDWSFGLMQTLTNTAWFVSNLVSLEGRFPKPVPKGGDVNEWRKLLFNPRTSIILGSRYLREHSEEYGTKDPVVLYAAYNAGGAYKAANRQWGLLSYGPPDRPDQALDNFTAWYGDACAAFRGME